MGAVRKQFSKNCLIFEFSVIEMMASAYGETEFITGHDFAVEGSGRWTLPSEFVEQSSKDNPLSSLLALFRL